MLIPFPYLYQYLLQNNIKVNGILHVGAHLCEELAMYYQCGIHLSNMYWIEANKKLVDKNTANGIPNVLHYVVDEKSDVDVTFKITNNGQSSSILELNKHLDYYPDIVVTEVIPCKTTTIKDIFHKHQLSEKKLNFWTLDIQGNELQALKGAGDLLNDVDCIYTEVNTEELYKNGCFINQLDEYLETFGFKREAVKMSNDGWGDAFYVKRK